MHWKKDCWWNPEKGGGKAKGKGGGGAPPQRASPAGGKGAKEQPKCWTCGQEGHRAAQCPKKKDVGSLEEEPEPAGEFSGLFLCALDSTTRRPNRAPEKISFGIDSGAAVTMLPEDACTDYPLQKTEGFGNAYAAAGGHRIYDQGSRTIYADVHGALRGLRPRVGKVKKALIAVYDMCKAGHRVVFDLEGDEDLSHAENKATGERTKFNLRKRVWEIDAKVPPYNNTNAVWSQAAAAPKSICPFEGQVAWP